MLSNTDIHKGCLVVKVVLWHGQCGSVIKLVTGNKSDKWEKKDLQNVIFLTNRIWAGHFYPQKSV